MIASIDGTTEKCHRCGQEGQATFEKKIWCRSCLSNFSMEMSRKSKRWSTIAIIFAVIAILTAVFSFLRDICKLMT